MPRFVAMIMLAVAIALSGCVISDELVGVKQTQAEQVKSSRPPAGGLVKPPEKSDKAAAILIPDQPIKPADVQP